MILVDSSVWIDYFRGRSSAEANRLSELLGVELIATGDMMLAELLQGFDSERDFNQALHLLSSVEIVEIAGREVVVQAARNFRTLRRLGVTVRKTINTLTATRCIESGHSLLYSDRDFDPFVQHLSLANAMATPS